MKPFDQMTLEEIEAIEKAAVESAANMGAASPDQIFIEGFSLTQIIEAGLAALRNKL